MQTKIIAIFLELIEMYMHERIYEILSMTAIHDRQAKYFLKIKIVEYDSSGHVDDMYTLIFKIFLDEKNKDVDFAILNEDGGDCIKINQDAMAYTEEMVKEENARYKKFLLESFSDCF